jgi:hypothetical protein
MSWGRFARALAAAVGWALVPVGPAAGAEAAVSTPAQVPGLTAWYEVGSLHRHTRDGDTIRRWADSSRQGHDLTATGEDVLPRFETLALNGKPVVAVGQANRFDVANPFELDDHTIFLVFGSEYTERALFRSDSDSRRGVILGENGRSHEYQNGKEGRFRYTRPGPLELGFGITVLGRESGVLKGFVNGADVSSDVEFPESIRVGAFFRLRHTTFVESDGEGLRVAEMIFYDRYLTESERAAVTQYLSDEYGIAVADDAEIRRVVEHANEIPIDENAVLVRLATRTPIDVNHEFGAIGWDAVDRVETPFRFDAAAANTELHCVKDGTRVHVTVTLPLQSEVADARIRMLLLRNGRDYHAEEAVNSRFEGSGADKQADLCLRTELTLDAGDFVEVVTSRSGAPGEVRIRPDGGLFVIEKIE